MSSARRAAAAPRRFRPQHAVLLAAFAVLGLGLIAIPFLSAPSSAQSARADLDAARAALQAGDVSACMTSFLPGEGKTTTAINLALTTAMAG